MQSNGKISGNEKQPLNYKIHRTDIKNRGSRKQLFSLIVCILLIALSMHLKNFNYSAGFIIKAVDRALQFVFGYFALPPKYFPRTVITIVLCIALAIGATAVEVSVSVEKQPISSVEIDKVNSDNPANENKIYSLENIDFVDDSDTIDVITNSILYTLQQIDYVGQPDITLINNSDYSVYTQHADDKYKKAYKNYMNNPHTKTNLKYWINELDECIKSRTVASSSQIVSGNLRIVAIYNVEKGDAFIKMHDYEKAYISYQEAIKAAVKTLYATIQEGPDYGSDANDVFDLIIDAYGRILALEDKNIRFNSPHIKSIIQGYQNVKAQSSKIYDKTN